MNSAPFPLPFEDAVAQRLTLLYKKLGYEKYTMNKFEPYELYQSNMDFLSCPVTTFTDPSGRLMALKPDVTISIVSSAAADGGAEKYFYLEKVYRTDSSLRECREISQMGLEYIGASGAYCEAEVLYLALMSLKSVGKTFALDVSHMGFVSAVFNSLKLSERTIDKIKSAMAAKNFSEVEKTAFEAGVNEQDALRLKRIASLSGEFLLSLKEAFTLARGECELKALNELREVYEALVSFCEPSGLNLDFSVMNNIKYYNGIIFCGYIMGIPSCVLSGGRYDLLMRRFNKNRPALGFALYLDMLESIGKKSSSEEKKALIVAQNEIKAPVIARAVLKLCSKYDSVRVALSDEEAKPTETVYYLKEKTEPKEKEENA